MITKRWFIQVPFDFEDALHNEAGAGTFESIDSLENEYTVRDIVSKAIGVDIIYVGATRRRGLRQYTDES